MAWLHLPKRCTPPTLDFALPTEHTGVFTPCTHPLPQHPFLYSGWYLAHLLVIPSPAMDLMSTRGLHVSFHFLHCASVHRACRHNGCTLTQDTGNLLLEVLVPPPAFELALLKDGTRMAEPQGYYLRFLNKGWWHFSLALLIPPPAN